LWAALSGTLCAGPKAYDKKRAKRLGKAQERRKKAIERAAPKALNPYASDSDDDAAPAAAPDAAAASDDEAAAAEEVEEELDDEAWAKAVQSGNLSKGERLVPVDHTRISYPAFRKVRPSRTATPCSAARCLLSAQGACAQPPLVAPDAVVLAR